MRGKLRQLETEVALLPHGPKIVALTETWLGADDSDDLFASPVLNGFALFRQDRHQSQAPGEPLSRGGGVCALISSDLLPVRVPVRQPAETVWIDLLAYQPPLRLAVCYLPYVTGENVTDLLGALEEGAPLEQETPLLIVGDFNLRHIDWDTFTVAAGDTHWVHSDMLLEAFTLRGLSQLVRDPTHVQGGILDLVLSSDPFLIEDTLVGTLFSDHRLVSCSLALPVPVARRPRWWDWRSADYAAMVTELSSVNWTQAFSHCANVDDAWLCVATQLLHLRQCYVQEKTSPHTQYPYTSHPRTKRLIRQKSRLTAAIARELVEGRKEILIQRRDLLAAEIDTAIQELDKEKQQSIAAIRNTTEGTVPSGIDPTNRLKVDVGEYHCYF